MKNTTTEVMNFVQETLLAIIKLLRSGDLPGALALISAAQLLVTKYKAGLEQYIPNLDFTTFPKKNILSQLTWVVRNLPSLIQLAHAGDYLAEARADARTFAATYGFTVN